MQARKTGQGPGDTQQHAKTEDGPKGKKMKAATVPSNISRVKIASAKIENLQAEVNLKTEVLKKTVDSAARKDILTARPFSAS
jgi:hypothetical protein